MQQIKKHIIMKEKYSQKTPPSTPTEQTGSKMPRRYRDAKAKAKDLTKYKRRKNRNLA